MEVVGITGPFPTRPPAPAPVAWGTEVDGAEEGFLVVTTTGTPEATGAWVDVGRGGLRALEDEAAEV